ncbi:hypothetical protein GBAR_LOCUS20152 [Geodia barretti]|uniref:Fibronectin type-III domain-containing protein n=1 Tax=Geodia barretti TaxID=519541 RepID=A0AA35SVR5_GEOBA|nr:hypothetical protein GBAR_LOCUS20152 [Geodia barretti]
MPRHGQELFPRICAAYNTSMTLTLELEDVHVNISSVFIQAITAEDDGVNRSSSEQVVNGTLPMILNFTLSSLSAYTYYNVRAVATYVLSKCNTNQYAGHPKMIWTEPGVPDSPAELKIENNGIASWDAVNPRTDNPRISYILEVIGVDDEEIAVTKDVGNTRNANLNDFNLEVGQNYNVCVLAMNNIGNGKPSCVLYTHMMMPTPVYLVCRRKNRSLTRSVFTHGPDLELKNIHAQCSHQTTTDNNESLCKPTSEPPSATVQELKEELSKRNMLFPSSQLQLTKVVCQDSPSATVQELKEELSKRNMLFPSSQLQLTKVVGQGEFGLVYRGYIKTTNELVAVKTGKGIHFLNCNGKGDKTGMGSTNYGFNIIPLSPSQDPYK